MGLGLAERAARHRGHRPYYFGDRGQDDQIGLLFTVPNQLGVGYNARILETIAKHIAHAFGWTPSDVAAMA